MLGWQHKNKKTAGWCEGVLQRKTPLQAKTQLQAKKPMPKKRSKRAREKDFSAAVKKIVLNRSDGMCEICRVKRIEEFHHAIYRSQGGMGTLDNCLGLCRTCHEGGHALKGLRDLYVEVAQNLSRSDSV